MIICLFLLVLGCAASQGEYEPFSMNVKGIVIEGYIFYGNVTSLACPEPDGVINVVPASYRVLHPASLLQSGSKMHHRVQKDALYDYLVPLVSAKEAHVQTYLSLNRHHAPIVGQGSSTTFYKVSRVGETNHVSSVFDPAQCGFTLREERPCNQTLLGEAQEVQQRHIEAVPAQSDEMAHALAYQEAILACKQDYPSKPLCSVDPVKKEPIGQLIKACYNVDDVDDVDPCILGHSTPLFAHFWTRLNTYEFVDGCVGPTGHNHGKRYKVERVPKCPNDRELCHCVVYKSEKEARSSQLRTAHVRVELRKAFTGDDRVWRHRALKESIDKVMSQERAQDRDDQEECYQATGHLPQTAREACLMDLRCNWDPTKSPSECADATKSAFYCGPQKGAGDYSRPPQCYSITRTALECEQQGGIPKELGRCVFPDLSANEDDCLPPEICPPRPGIFENRELALGARHCAPSCTADVGNCTSLGAGGWWNTQLGKCQLPQRGRDCEHVWFPGRTYEPGILHTRALCEAGRCSTDPRLSPSECTIIPGCTQKCYSPEQISLCYTYNGTKNDCIEHIPSEGACLYVEVQSEDECMDRNATWEIRTGSKMVERECLSEQECPDPNGWRLGEVISSQWKRRQFEALNHWGPTIDWDALYARLQYVADQAVADDLRSELMCTYHLPFALERRLIPGLKMDWDIPHAHIHLQSGSADGVTLKVTPNSLGSTHKRSPSMPNEHEVVTNLVGYIVGQLISEGVSLTLPPSTTVRLCITVDQSIPRDPEMIYPTIDFAAFNGTAYTPVGFADAVEEGNFTSVCANVSDSGTYYAILRVADPWENITALPTTTPITGTSTTPPITTTGVTGTTLLVTTEPATLVTVESSLSATAIISIIIGSVVGVALITVIVACCVHRNTSRKSMGYTDLEALVPAPRTAKAQRHSNVNHQGVQRQRALKRLFPKRRK